MKTKWFSASVHNTYRELREKLIGHQFDEELGWGFQIIKYSPNRFQARYSEKISVNEIIIDPYGVENVIEYYKYINFNFWLISDKIGEHILVIENPPRTIKTFIENFVKCINSDFYVSIKNIIIESFVDSFKEDFDEVSFKKAKLKGLSFSKYTSGNLEIESSKDALLDIKSFFLNSSYRVDKAKIIISKGSFSHCVEITSGGTIIFDEEIFENIVKAVVKL
ncbi:hypothetical protein H5A20_02220 [Pectobacterium brasiliense]|uniref:hypothetical protein n=1 Tax=Pectobacterium brasiliense TaxID=180957 RepID=UPI0019690FED|nr:hypothetical protein [Pectobacterium brasiliense]MBN3197520.1 hypothetical protein [Pectobacterium brasiliense]